MAARGNLKSVENESEFETTTVTIRGTEYTLSEVDGKTFDECRAAAIVGKNEQGMDLIDFEIEYRALLEKSLINPRLTLKDINAKPMRVRTELIAAMVEVVFGAQKAEEQKDEEPGKDD